MSEENIAKINEIIAQHFAGNTFIDWVAAKTIMPALVEVGIFKNDEKKGLPLRKVLRKLDQNNTLNKVPTAHAERNGKNVYWYFVRPGKTYTPKEVINSVSKKEKRLLQIQNSDEYYLVSLCNELLGQEASRKHTFDTLVGNLSKKGKTRSKLPLDAYYEDLKLVIQFYKKNETSEELDEKELARVEQINYYDQLKKKAVLKKKLNLLEVNYALFECDENNKLVRHTENDVVVLKSILKKFIKH